ncbi:MAG TPA: VanZ family protein [Bryobacteraceae bacterium]|nr:VanZ family protein [Bryobacteraceae bacterium]
MQALERVERWKYRTCLLLFLALTAAFSLYPWTLRATPLGPSPWILLTSPDWLRFGLRLRGDVISNVLFYLPLGLFGVWSLSPARSKLWRVAIATLGCTLVSLAIEIAQFYVSSRVTSPTDLLTNCVGALLGATLGAWFESRRDWHAAVIPALLMAAYLMRSVALPFAPVHYSRYLEIGLFLGAVWILVANRGWPRINLIVCVGILSLLIAEELEPFRFSSQTHDFVWTPFVATLSVHGAQRIFAFTTKLYLYGLSLFAVTRLKVRLLPAAISLAVLLLGLELLQTHLPGRTPESTDAVLVILWALVMMLL